MTLNRYVGEDAAGKKFYTRAATVEDARDNMAEEAKTADLAVTELPASAKAAEIATLVKINAPDWYERADFVAWLRGKAGTGPPPATWHSPENEEPGEYSDVFVTIELGSPVMSFGEGSDSDMPADIWDELCQVVEAAGVQYGLVWVSNIEE